MLLLEACWGAVVIVAGEAVVGGAWWSGLVGRERAVVAGSWQWRGSDSSLVGRDEVVARRWARRQQRCTRGAIALAAGQERAGGRARDGRGDGRTARGAEQASSRARRGGEKRVQVRGVGEVRAWVLGAGCLGGQRLGSVLG